MTIRYPLVLNGSQIQELQNGDSIAGTADQTNLLLVGTSYRAASTAPIPNTIAARDSSGDIYANVLHGVATSARYADLAEKYISDNEYDEGTVVVFGGTNEITTTTMYADTRVAGVISAKPAYLMNNDSAGQPVALRGKVPVKVTGTVKKGDLLITSDVAGYAIAAFNPDANAVFAKSLEDKEVATPGTVIAVIL
jgi:hypothetical protein